MVSTLLAHREQRIISTLDTYRRPLPLPEDECESEEDFRLDSDEDRLLWEELRPIVAGEEVG